MRSPAVRATWLLSALPLLASPPLLAEVDAPVADDTFTLGTDDSGAHGSARDLRLESGAGAVWLRFDLTTLPEEATGADVAGATLRLWVRKVIDPGDIGVRVAMEPWSEDSLAGGAAPALLDAEIARAAVGREGARGFIALEVTDLLRVWMEGSLPNHGLALVLEGRGGSFVFDSKESVRGGHEPELRVRFGAPQGGWGQAEAPLNLRGPQGPPGDSGPPGGSGPPGPGLNPLKVARRIWHEGDATARQHPSGTHPIVALYAGKHVWFVNWESDRVTRLDPATGLSAGSFVVGDGPSGLGSDTVSLWVLNNAGDSVTRLALVNGASLGTIPVGDGPTGAAFDGTHMWIANNLGNSVMKLRARDAVLLATYPLADGPRRIAYDGASLWITCSRSNTVVRMRPDDGAVLATHGGFHRPLGIAFDGGRLWVANFEDRTVTAIAAADGSFVRTVDVGWDAFEVAWDGQAIWVSSAFEDRVTKIDPEDGAVLGVFQAGDTPEGIAFDGARVWVSNSRSNTASVY